jgi:hypothetical protein
MTSNKRAIGILLGMLILAMVVGAVLNRERSGGVLTSLGDLLTGEEKTETPSPEAETPSAQPSVTPNATPVAPEPAEPTVQPQAQTGPMPWEELTPDGEIPAWRKNASAVLYKLLPELIPPLPYVTPDASPMPERTEEELTAERTKALELASAALERIAPAQAAPIPAPPAAQAVAPEKTPATSQAASPAPNTAAKTSPEPEGSSARAKPGLISSITLECGPRECTLRIETKPPLGRIAYFHKIQPSRLALDLYGNWIFHGPSILPGNEDLVERIRLGVHPDRFRVVLDYKGDQDTLRSEPVIEERGNTLLVKIAK